MTIRKVANRTTKLAVSATTTQVGIYKAAIVTAQTIKRIANASTSLVPKAHLVADQLIARLLLNPESSGLQNYYDWQYFADQLGLLLNRPARDSFSLSDELTTSFIIGRGQSYPGLRDRIFATDDRLGLLINAKRTFTDAASPQDRPFLFLGKSARADRVDFSDFILISRIKTFNDSILTADQVSRIVRFNRTFGDTVGMLDAFTLIDGSTFSLDRRITESPLFIGSGIDQRSSSAERISFILDKVLDPDMELLDQLSKQIGKGVKENQVIADLKKLYTLKPRFDNLLIDQTQALNVGKLSTDRINIGTPYISSGSTSSSGSSVAVGGSATFNGSTQYLNIASTSAFGFGTADFTVEFWWKPTVNQRSDVLDFWSTGLGASITNRFDIGKITTSNLELYTDSPTGGGGSSAKITGPTIASLLNAWHHIAITRQSGSIKMWVNGTQAGSTYTARVLDMGSSMQLRIMGDHNASGNGSGNLSNVRVVKNVAVYTGAFTPPTSALALTQSSGTNISAITAGQTQLLLPLNATPFTDSSTNAITVTNTGTVTSSALTPF